MNFINNENIIKIQRNIIPLYQGLITLLEKIKDLNVQTKIQ